MQKMSINFEILKWHNSKSLTFPVIPDWESDELVERVPWPELVERVPWPQIKKYLISLGACPYSNEDVLVIGFENEGVLQIRGVPDETGSRDGYVSIYFHVKASWNNVLSIYIKALEFDPELVLFDPQEGIFHNAETFQPLAIEQYEYQQNNCRT
jgi:hypothetical protein